MWNVQAQNLSLQKLAVLINSGEEARNEGI